MNTKRICLFSGSSHPELAANIASGMGISLGKLQIRSFPDGEIGVQLGEEVQGKEIFVLQSLASRPNHYLMELLIIIDALKRSGATKITALIPYLAYSRQDRQNVQGEPITAKLVADLLTAAGVTHLIAIDLHADQVEGFFNIPVVHLRCRPLLSEYAAKRMKGNLRVVAPDIGSVKTAEGIAKHLKKELVIIQKERLTPEKVIMKLIGEVAGCDLLLVDDLCSTGNTLLAAARLCCDHGAGTMAAVISHGLFAEDALRKLVTSGLSFMVTSDTIPQKDHCPKLETLSVAPLIMEHLFNVMEKSHNKNN